MRNLQIIAEQIKRQYPRDSHPPALRVGGRRGEERRGVGADAQKENVPAADLRGAKKVGPNPGNRCQTLLPHPEKR